MPKGTDPGMFSVNPNGSINGTTAKQVYSFTHFDAWAYGTNFFTISMFKSGHNDPASPCIAPGVTITVGAGQLRRRHRNLRPVPFDLRLQRDLQHQGLHHGAAAQRLVRSRHGRQHREQLPGAGQARRRRRSAVRIRSALQGLRQRRAVDVLGVLQPQRLHPVRHCLPRPVAGRHLQLATATSSYRPTWAVEVNYYMDLGFLPPNMQYLLDQRPRRLVRTEGRLRTAFRRFRAPDGSPPPPRPSSTASRSV